MDDATVHIVFTLDHGPIRSYPSLCGTKTYRESQVGDQCWHDSDDAGTIATLVEMGSDGLCPECVEGWR